MPTIKFIGRVVPAGNHLTIPCAIDGTWQDADLRFPMHYHITIENDIVIADCEVENYERAHMPRMLLRAIDTSQAAVDLAAFAFGAPLLIAFDTFAELKGKNLPLRVADPDLAVLVTAFSLDPTEFDEALRIVLGEPNVFHALRDLIDAISGPHKIVPHCAKAIETLRNVLTPSGMERKQGWIVMQEALRVSGDYLKFITGESVAPRHGNHQAITGQTTNEVAQRAWIVMNRFLEFRKRGSQPLPVDEFPLLTG